MSWLPDDVREASGGEVIDRAARDAVRLAHHALDRFPELVRKHKFLAGGAAISSSLVALAAVAITRRILHGQSAEEAVSTVTEAELQGLGPVPPRRRPPSSNNALQAPGTPAARDSRVTATPHTATRAGGHNGAGSSAGTGADVTPGR